MSNDKRPLRDLVALHLYFFYHSITDTNRILSLVSDAHVISYIYIYIYLMLGAYIVPLTWTH